jgi:hypothetical protein
MSRDDKGKFIKGYKYPKEWAEKRVRPKGLKYKLVKENPTKFKKGLIPWNTGTKGLIKPNKGNFKKGEHRNPQTEFKRSSVSGKKNWNWKGGISALYRRKHATRKKPEQCEICGALGTICCDHNHQTGKFRGWICHRCNFAIGLVKDNTETLNSMINYLKNC